MKIKIQVEFEVRSDVEDDELTEDVVKSAASLAAWNNLCLTNNGIQVVDEVTVHVDGFGECVVRVGEDHD